MANRLPDLVGRLRLDTRDLDKAKGEVDKFGRDVNAAGGRVGLGLSSGLDSATSSLTGSFGAAGLAAKTKLDSIGNSALASGSALQFGLGAGALAGGLILTKFATDGVASFMTLAEEVRDFSRSSGASAEDSSRFVAVLDDLQISSGAGASAIFKLGLEVAAGAPKLRQFGIEVDRNRDGTSNLTETLLNVADAYSKAPDQATKTSIAFAAFGKQAAGLIPLLSKGRIGLEDFFAGAEGHGQLLSQADLDQAEELRLSLDELNDAMRGVQIIGAKALVPFISQVSDLAAKTFGFLDGVEKRSGGIISKIGAGALKSFAGPVAPILDLLPDGDKTKAEADTTAGALDGVAGSMDGLSGATAEQAESTGTWLASFREAQRIIAAVNRSTDDRRKAVLSVIDAEAGNRRSILSFADAVDDVRAKERDLADARRGRGDATRDVISIERALNSVEDAQSSIVDHERALADARAGRGSGAREIADAEKELARAREDAAGAHGLKDQKEAAEQVADAEERLRRAREDGGQAEDVRSATEALSRSQLDAREAALSLAEARETAANREKESESALFASRESARTAAIGAARAAQELAEQQAAASNVKFTVSDGYNVFRNTLIGLKDELAEGSPLRVALEGTINSIGEIPATKRIAVEVAGIDAAFLAFGSLGSLVAAIKGDIDRILSPGAIPTLRAPPLPGVAALVPAGARPVGPGGILAGGSTTNFNTTVVAPGVNADVAREIDKRTARAAARAR